MNAFTWIITILGFIATIVGSILAIFTFVSSIWRLKFYLKKPLNWRKVYIGRIKYNWQYKNHPEFTIEVDDENKNWDTGVKENWMRDYPNPTKSTSLVRIKANGQVLMVENFISLDGGRYFVPLPKRHINTDQEKENEYWYTPLQVNLSRIVGEYYRGDSIEDFIKSHNLKIETRNDEL